MKVNPVSRRLRRLPAALLPLLLVAAAAGCGSDDSGDQATSRLDAVTITGDQGAAPKVTWKDQMSAGSIESKTLTTGDGPKVEDGDSVLAEYWLGDGFTKKKAVSTFDPGGDAQVLTLNDQVNPIFKPALEGQTIGSRVAVTASADKAFGEFGNAQLGIANKDSVLLLVDLVSPVLDGPDGQTKTAPSWAPKVVEKDGKVTSLDFSGTPKPSAQLRTATLVQGTGPAVAKGKTMVMRYLGQVYGAAKPFDENYSGDPMARAIGVGNFVKGWDQALTGVKVGSRVMIAIPPKLGYGTAGNKQAKIKGTDTLYFVVDVLAGG
jgi:peptidylprolyl isomerase